MRNLLRNNGAKERAKSRTRKLSIKEGSAYSISDGFGIKYITPYALAMNASNSQIGLLSSIPTLLGNISQIYTTKLMEKYPRNQILFIGAMLQAFMWLPVLGVGIFFFFFNSSNSFSIDLLILFYTMLVAFGSFISPAWNSLMKDIVTRNSGKYFGTRNRVCGLVALVSMLLASFLLDYFKHTKVFFGFIALFSMAFIFRSLSAIMLKNYYEPRLKLEKEYYFTFLQFIKNIPKSNFGKFVVFVSLSTLATQIASPFFAVYMLRELNFSYTFWISTVISSILASLLFMPIWGKFTDKYGTVKTLKITGIFTPLVPFLWLLSPLLYKINFYLLLAYIIIVESFSGFIWAGFNLAAGNFIYDAVTRQRMALCIAYFSVINSIGFFIGASFGGIVSSMSSIPFGISPLIFVFFISGIARFLVYIFVSPTIKEVRTVKDLDIKNMHKDLLDFKPKKILNHLK